MDIRQLLDPLLLRPNIEVVVSRLPHKFLHPRLREPLFQSLHSDRQQSRPRLTHQQMDVSRHHHIPKDMHRIKYTSPLQQLDEAIPSLGRLKNPAMPKTTDRNVMEIAGLLIALKTCWHCEECSRGEERCRASARPRDTPRCRAKDARRGWAARGSSLDGHDTIKTGIKSASPAVGRQKAPITPYL
jgi:hypothetical protein